MVMKDNGDVEFESDILDCEDMLPLKDCTEDEVVLPVEESLIIRRTLQVQVKEDDNDLQRENIFHTRCYGVMAHPSDGEVWKHFNRVHPQFSLESNNVRLGLCTYKFNPFESFTSSYYC